MLDDGLEDSLARGGLVDDEGPLAAGIALDVQMGLEREEDGDGDGDRLAGCRGLGGGLAGGLTESLGLWAIEEAPITGCIAGSWAKKRRV